MTRLIYINCGVFLALKVMYIFFVLAGRESSYSYVTLSWLGLPADLEHLFSHLWTVFTYMFIQMDFVHLLFNMLWLYWFGNLFLNHFTERQLTGVYLMGGVSGALFFLAAYNLLPYFDPIVRLSSWAIGASASVMAIVFAVCTYLPQHTIYLFFIGPIKLIYLALFTALIDLISIPYENPGGHIAHLGGACFGYLFVLGIRNQKDISVALFWIIDPICRLFAGPKKLRVKKTKKKVSEMSDQEYNTYKRQQEDNINAILDKISKSGYESLTREEKEILFKGKH